MEFFLNKKLDDHYNEIDRLEKRHLNIENDKELSEKMWKERLERETERYWSSCYFAEQMVRDPQRTWRAVLLGWHRRHTGSTYYAYSVGVVYLSEVGHECIAFVDDASGMKPGDVMRVRCTEADPALGQVKLVQHSAPLLA